MPVQNGNGEGIKVPENKLTKNILFIWHVSLKRNHWDHRLIY